ncbi:hypothetical protein, partial [Dethiosulfovibrio salsuginis]
MTEVGHIRDAYFNKGENISEIAKKFSKDRKTVRKYIQQDNFNRSSGIPHLLSQRRKAGMDSLSPIGDKSCF